MAACGRKGLVVMVAAEMGVAGLKADTAAEPMTARRSKGDRNIMVY